MKSFVFGPSGRAIQHSPPRYLILLRVALAKQGEKVWVNLTAVRQVSLGLAPEMRAQGFRECQSYLAEVLPWGLIPFISVLMHCNIEICVFRIKNPLLQEEVTRIITG
jgi:hypothetical protein